MRADQLAQHRIQARALGRKIPDQFPDADRLARSGEEKDADRSAHAMGKETHGKRLPVRGARHALIPRRE